MSIPTPPLSTERAAGFASPQEEALLTLLRSADFFERAVQQRLKPYGLTHSQYNVLRILRHSQDTGLTCSSIGSRMITPDPDITRLLTRLKAQTLVRQQRDHRDRRVVWTHITTQGLQILRKLDGVIAGAPQELLHDLNGEEIHQLTLLLKKVQRSVSMQTSNAECRKPELAPPDQDLRQSRENQMA